MEKIEGIDLAEITKETEEFILHEKKAEVSRVIRAIFSDVAKWETQIRVKQQEIASLQGKLQAAVDKVAKLREGDWNVLPKPQSPKEGEAKTN